MEALRCGMRAKSNDKIILLIQDLRKGDRMLEVGCFAGEDTLYFLQSGKFNELHAVDPWRVETDFSGFDESAIPRLKVMYNDMAWAERSFDRRMEGFNVVKHKSTLTECQNILPKFEFIYLDSDYRYEPYLKDIGIALSLLKEGGQIGGKMYDKECTRQAIAKYFNRVKTYPEHSWLWLG